MSHVRSRGTKNSQSLYIPKKKVLNTSQLSNHQYHKRNDSTMASLLTIPNHKKRKISNQQTIFNKNIFLFRQIFNQNDQSQLPFMSTLRQHPKDNTLPKQTSLEPFEVSMKTTCNQMSRKRVSDFNTTSKRLATSYYRWHNKTGRSTLWSTQFESTLRDYGQHEEEEKRYFSYVKPIVYKDFDTKVYNKSDMICDRHHRSFVVK